MYTSPHLGTNFCSVIRINNNPVPKKIFEKVVKNSVVPASDNRTTQFEALTASAFECFRVMGVEAWVVEVGLGGQHDATNVIRAPDVAVITPIDYDHCSILGKTLKDIATVKSKIIKPGTKACVTALQHDEVMNVLKHQCEITHVPLHIVGPTQSIAVKAKGTWFAYQGKTWKLRNLLGSHQPGNAAIAIEVARALVIPEKTIHQGLLKATWPGRCEIVLEKTRSFRDVDVCVSVMLDGAHNKSGME
eukprot:PhF_6_TR521/c0_g1_i4/m.316/K11754/folC; dihydrofolate synthase / folylpolyglutamate synthase